MCANKTQILIQHRRRFSIVEIGFFYFFFCFDFCIKLNSSFINKLDFLYEVFFISRNSTNKISTTILLLLRKKNNDQFFGKTRKKTAGLQEKFFHKFLILNSKQEINKQIQVYIKWMKESSLEKNLKDVQMENFFFFFWLEHNRLKRRGKNFHKVSLLNFFFLLLLFPYLDIFTIKNQVCCCCCFLLLFFENKTKIKNLFFSTKKKKNVTAVKDSNSLEKFQFWDSLKTVTATAAAEITQWR